MPPKLKTHKFIFWNRGEMLIYSVFSLPPPHSLPHKPYTNSTATSMAWNSETYHQQSQKPQPCSWPKPSHNNNHTAAKTTQEPQNPPKHWTLSHTHTFIYKNGIIMQPKQQLIPTSNLIAPNHLSKTKLSPTLSKQNPKILCG